MKPLKERQIESYLIRRVILLGGEVRKLKYIGRRSATDRLILLPGRHIFVELKKPTFKASACQAREHRKLRWAGCEVHLIDTLEKINYLLNL